HGHVDSEVQMTGSLGRYVILALSGAALAASPAFAQPAKVTEFKVSVWSLGRTLLGEDKDPEVVAARNVGDVFITIRDKDNLNDATKRLRRTPALTFLKNMERYPHVCWDDDVNKRVTAVRIEIEREPKGGPTHPRGLKPFTLAPRLNIKMAPPVVMPGENPAM